jgi:hypothetical protein
MNTVIHKIARAALASLIISFGGMGRAVYAGQQDFTLHNLSGYTIQAVYISPVGKNSWEEDVLGSGVLVNGASTRIRFDGYGNNQCYWDIKVRFSDGTESNGWSRNLCKLNHFDVT